MSRDEAGFWVLKMLYQPNVNPSTSLMFNPASYRKRMRTIFGGISKAVSDKLAMIAESIPNHNLIMFPI